VPLIKSSIKDVRRTKKRRERNIVIYSRLRGSLAKARAAATPEDALKAFREAERLLDKAAGKGFVHKKKAARLKSRLAHRMKGLKK
jgi:small subunit ribosomal protein S20